VEETMLTNPSRPPRVRRRVALRVVAAVLAVAALLLPATSALAAGRVAGAVLNGLTGQPVPGVTVTLEGTEISTRTDPDGLFLADAPAGSFTALLSKDGFKMQQVTDVAVTDGKVTNFSVVLIPAEGSTAAEESAAFQDTITVSDEADATAAALLAERRQAAQISDSIGNIEMAKDTGSDAAGALKRVTGISLQDNKYVYVRGLGERYSNTTLNGAKVPSTEFDRKVVPLDLFSSDLLEKITVSKSYTVDKPGDFAAGFVNMETRQFPANRVVSVGLGAGYNTATTGSAFAGYGSGLSFSGNGGQVLPGSIPDDDLIRFSRFTGKGYTPQELEAFGEQLVGDWTPSPGGDAPLEQSYKLSYGNTFGDFGLLLSANYGHGYQVRNEERNIFSVRADGGVTPRNTYAMDFNDEEVRQSLVGNLSYRLGSNAHVELRTLYTNLSSAEARTTTGFFSDLSSNVLDRRISFREQEVVNAQLSGEHFLPNAFASGSLLEWRVSSSTAETTENRRQTLYEELQPGRFELTDNASSGFLYFNDLEDDLTDSGVDWTTFLGGKVVGSVKLGAAYTENERDFQGRRLRFAHRNTRGIDLTLPPEELFTEEYIGPNGFELEEITRPTDNYLGKQEITAAYAQADLTFGKWRFIGGLRAEESVIDLVTLERGLNAGNVTTELDENELLPALTLVYRLSADQNLRFAASRTVNRPDFRELAPFKYTHIAGGHAVTGNPDLVSAKILSYDVRWEWFPGTDEVVAASLFYKDFEDPIENVLVASAETLQTYTNAASAENYGLELEARRNLGSLTPSLSDVTVIFNYTYVDSQISIDPAVTSFTTTDRPLSGQPENVLNLVAEWSRPEWGTGVRLLFNFTDDKVAFGGELGLPDVIEDARTTVDLVWNQDLSGWVPGLGFKLSATNLLDEERSWSQGNGVYRLYEPGVGYGLSLSFRPF
jgi:outer membrane receptor protein involved in Fe transport